MQEDVGYVEVGRLETTTQVITPSENKMLHTYYNTSDIPH